MKSLIAAALLILGILLIMNSFKIGKEADSYIAAGQRGLDFAEKLSKQND